MPDFIYSRETTFGTWVTPAKWLPVESSEIGGEREKVSIRSTGGGPWNLSQRARRKARVGADDHLVVGDATWPAAGAFLPARRRGDECGDAASTIKACASDDTVGSAT